jgi:hypothetical protein
MIGTAPSIGPGRSRTFGPTVGEDVTSRGQVIPSVLHVNPGGMECGSGVNVAETAFPPGNM